MTTPNGGIPEGGRSYEQMAELVTIQPPVQANPDLWANAEAARNSFFGNILSGFLTIGHAIGSALADLAAALFGNYTGSDSTLIEIQEGQTAYQERVDLLADNGYCSMTLNSQVSLAPHKNLAVPFNARIGPMNHAEPTVVNRTHPGDTVARDEHVIRLDRPGLWQANVSMVQSQSAWESYAEIVVLRPDLTPYTALSLPTPRGERDGSGSGNNDMPSQGKPISLFKMFVVPAPGYYVQVRYECVNDGSVPVYKPRIRGGSQFAQFAVTQWSADVEATNAPENPTSEIIVE